MHNKVSLLYLSTGNDLYPVCLHSVSILSALLPLFIILRDSSLAKRKAGTPLCLSRKTTKLYLFTLRFC